MMVYVSGLNSKGFQDHYEDSHSEAWRRTKVSADVIEESGRLVVQEVATEEPELLTADAQD